MAVSVLVVDDDPDFLDLITRILFELGVKAVRSAENATQALEVVGETRPDAVLVDVGLPDRSGIDLAYDLSDMPWCPHVVLTSSDSDSTLALDPRGGRPKLPFIAKEALGTDTLQRVLLDR